MTDRSKKLMDLVHDFRFAMLVTRVSDSEMRSRPMTIADTTDTARLWFMTSNKSGKLEELTEFPQVNVSMQGDGHYISISGTARTSKDRARIEKLWNPLHRAWFDGPDDPELVLVEVVPTTAEYWDNSGFEGIKVILRGIKAALTDGEPAYDADVHAKVQFPDRVDDEAKSASS